MGVLLEVGGFLASVMVVDPFDVPPELIEFLALEVLGLAHAAEGVGDFGVPGEGGDEAASETTHDDINIRMGWVDI